MPSIVMPTPSVSFPLEVDQLPNVILSNAQANDYRHLAKEIVTRTLHHETKFRFQDNGTLDDADWKFVKAKERMRVYKRIASSPTLIAFSSPSSSNTLSPSKHDPPLSPMVLAVGFMEGSLQDVLYGLHHKTTQEMRSVTKFLNKSHLDAAVLANIDQGTTEDPFRYLGLKWRVVQTPGPTAKLIRKRDVCALEHLGIDVDASGNKYGFHLMKSVDLAADQLSAAFPDESVVRAQVMLCCIYRQVTPTVVGVYAKGIFDLGGDLVDYMSYLTAAKFVLGIAKALKCAAAKRLTLLALNRNLAAAELMQSSSRQLSTIEPQDKAKGATGECSVCLKKRLYRGLKPLRTCRICVKSTCTKCFVKMLVFARPQNLLLVCCKACVIESRELEVDPRRPHPELGAEAYP